MRTVGSSLLLDTIHEIPRFPSPEFWEPPLLATVVNPTASPPSRNSILSSNPSSTFTNTTITSTGLVADPTPSYKRLRYPEVQLELRAVPGVDRGVSGR